MIFFLFFDTTSINAYVNVIFYVYSFSFFHPVYQYTQRERNAVFDIKIYTFSNATPVTNDKQSTEKKSCYVHEHDKLFTIIGNKSKYICRVLYETSLSMKGKKCYRDFYLYIQ